MEINLPKIYAVWYREVKRFTNSKARMVGSLGMPLLFLVALGGGLSAMVPGFNYASFVLPGIITMTLIFTSISSGVSIIWDREFGFLKEMLAAPTSRQTIVIGRMLGGSTTALIQGLIVLVVGLIYTGVAIPSAIDLLWIIVMMVVVSCMLVGVGICIASLVTEIETFQLINNLLVMPLFFLSNALIPTNKMPGWLQFLSNINPITYAVDSMRTFMLGAGYFGIWMDVGVSAFCLVIVVIVASFLFNKTSI